MSDNSTQRRGGTKFLLIGKENSIITLETVLQNLLKDFLNEFCNAIISLPFLYITIFNFY